MTSAASKYPTIPLKVGSDIVKDTNIVLKRLFPSIPVSSITLKEGTALRLVFGFLNIILASF
jgi:hypothetical protein